MEFSVNVIDLREHQGSIDEPLHREKSFFGTPLSTPFSPERQSGEICRWSLLLAINPWSGALIQISTHFFLQNSTLPLVNFRQVLKEASKNV